MNGRIDTEEQGGVHSIGADSHNFS
jgi:hypothetical protein